MIKRTIKLIAWFSAVAVGLAAFGVYQLYKNKFITIDPSLKEISGIEFDKKDNLWAINDGGSKACLHRIKRDGSVDKVITVTNAKNIDWEDMTQDDFGHFFLGDFGNNDKRRQWLTIYKIENPIDIKGNTTQAEIIKFTYPTSDDYPDKIKNNAFDIEAFVYYKRHLYLFTKNRAQPFDGESHLFRIGDHADNYDADYINTFTSCTINRHLCWITSAAMSPDNTKLALLDSTSIWIFENWQGDDFFSGDVSKIDLGIITQKEALTFYDNDTLIFTDEEFQGIGRNAYVINLKNELF